jgi:hypothetical protein
MAFWSMQSTDASSVKDPKRKFRFIVEIAGFDSGNATQWWAKTAAKPSFTIGAAEHKYLNHTFYYPGGATWNDVALTLVDPVSPDVGLTLADIVQLAGYSPPSTAADLATMTKGKAVSSLGTVTISQLDGAGSPLETWTLHNAWISELKFGDLEYGSDDLTELSVTLKYDWASMAGGTGQVSAAQGSTNTSAFTINGEGATSAGE